MKKNVAYIEPEDYFPKSIREKWFGEEKKPAKKTVKKTTKKKGK